ILENFPEASLPIAFAADEVGERYIDGRYLVVRANSFDEFEEVVTRLEKSGYSCAQPYSFSPLLYVGSALHCPHEIDGLLGEVREILGALGSADFEGIRIGLPAVVSVTESFLSDQWNLAAVGIPEAWSYEMGSPSVKVAVIDSGADLDHPGFAGRLEGGVNFVKETGLYDGDFPDDDESSHGTSVSSVIAAVAGNGFGIDGLDKGCKVVPLKVSHN